MNTIKLVQNKGSVGVTGGPRGKDGKSAYEIAVENGFKGTEAQWLASLQGESFKYEDFTTEQLAGLKGEAGENTVYVGTEEPVNSKMLIWINPNGGPTPTAEEVEY